VLRFWIYLFLAWPLWAKDELPEIQGKRYAFVVGINEYKDGRLPDLRNARNDAEGILRVLYQSGSYDKVKALVQPGSGVTGRVSKFEIESSFRAFLDQMGSNDFLFFYFSGHGFIDYDEKAYLMPEDGQMNSPLESGISIESFLLQARLRKLKKVIFVVDACRNPEQGTEAQGKKDLDSVSFSDSEITSVFYSTKLGYYSYEDDASAYGVFTKYLLSGLEGRADSNLNGQVTYSELSEYVINSLKDWSKKNQKLQKPYLKVYGEKTEDPILTYAYNPITATAEAPLFNPFNPTYAFRSLVFPGWGQYARGQETKGMVWMSLFGISLVHTGIRALEFQEARRDYRGAVGLPPGPRPLESLAFNAVYLTPFREREEEARSQFQVAMGLSLGIWALNLFDFYLFGPTKPQNSAFFWDARMQNTQLGRETLFLFGYETKH